MPEPLTVRIVSQRALVYTDTVAADQDRPPHVRAASAIAAHGGALYVVQDDAGFIARVHGDSVTAIPLPRGPGGRRRFEARLGNKLDKLDLESCVIVDDELWAFGSGTIPMREHVVRMPFGGAPRVTHEAALYASLRAAIGGPINIEGVARVGEAFWFCHRGNTSATDRPAIVRTDRAWRVIECERVELGSVGGVALGFTDACAVGDVVVFIASAEASANAIDDGRVAGNVIGVIGGGTAPLVVTGKPEGIAIRDAHHAWITVDPDDPDVPTTLYEVELVTINRSK